MKTNSCMKEIAEKLKVDRMVNSTFQLLCVCVRSVKSSIEIQQKGHILHTFFQGRTRLCHLVCHRVVGIISKENH